MGNAGAGFPTPVSQNIRMDEFSSFISEQTALCLAFDFLITDLKIGESGKGETDSEVQSLIKLHQGTLEGEGREGEPRHPSSPVMTLGGEREPVMRNDHRQILPTKLWG